MFELFTTANIIKRHSLPGRRQIQTQIHANAGNDGAREMVPNPMHMLRKVVATHMRCGLDRNEISSEPRALMEQKLSKTDRCLP